MINPEFRVRIIPRLSTFGGAQCSWPAITRKVERALPRAIATNGNTARANWKLRQTGLHGWIDVVVGIDQVARGKPAPDVYAEAARRLKLHPSQCVALDDSDLGIRSALAAGMKTVIQIPDMVPSREFRAHHQVASLDAARAILGLRRLASRGSTETCKSPRQGKGLLPQNRLSVHYANAADVAAGEA